MTELKEKITVNQISSSCFQKQPGANVNQYLIARRSNIERLALPVSSDEAYTRDTT